jgi:hypothetical protein
VGGRRIGKKDRNDEIRLFKGRFGRFLMRRLFFALFDDKVNYETGFFCSSVIALVCFLSAVLFKLFIVPSFINTLTLFWQTFSCESKMCKLPYLNNYIITTRTHKHGPNTWLPYFSVGLF